MRLEISQAFVFDLVYPSKRKPIQNALLFTAPDYGEGTAEHSALDWDYLIGSELEGFIIADTLATKTGITTELLTGESATKAKLLGGIEKDYSILHISSHGMVSDGVVNIIAADANNVAEEAWVSDTEISGYSLKNTSLAVLGLCFGASQLLLLQDSLSGFIKASLLAGINLVLAPINPVHDLSTVVILNEFYKHYLPNEHGDYPSRPEDALRKAMQRTRTISKAELLDEYSIEVTEEYPYAEPRHWDSWVCYSKEEL